MLNKPRTKEEAQAYRYGAWAGCPKGVPYIPSQCVQEIVFYEGHWPSYSQCSRKPGHGPDGLYCKQHAKMVEGS